jgi:ATP-dependent Clp protease protease subunit
MRTHNLNPIFFEKTKDGERIYDVSSRLIKDRTLYLDCEIDQEVSSQITSLLFLLDREDSEKKINLWISSPGGSTAGFFSIFDMMYRVKAPVCTVGMGEVCSAAAILLACGSSGMRYVMPNARVMIHQIQVGGMGGSNAEIDIEVKELRAQQEYLTEILARHTGHTKAKIKRDTKLDRWMSATDSVSYGLVDKILQPTKSLPDLLTREPKKVKAKPKREPDESEE